MQAIGERHTKGSQLDEDAIWREYAEDQDRQKTQYEVSSANLGSPYNASTNEFRKAIFGRQTAQRSGQIAAARGSSQAANTSGEYSEPTKLTRNRLPTDHSKGSAR